MQHVVATARLPNLILNRSEEALWQHLGETTTTPIKREWMPWIIAALESPRVQKLVKPSTCVGCDVGLCLVTDEDLDQLVSAAIKSGKVGIR